MQSSATIEWQNVGDLTPKYGDLIEIDRESYCFWVMSIGNGEIIHFNPAESEDKIGVLRPSEFVPGLVSKSSLTTIAGTSKVRINVEDYDVTPRTLDDMRKVVEIFLDKPSAMDYCLVDFNCEHFVRFVKFGVAFASQVNPATTGTMLTLLSNELSFSNFHRDDVSSVVFQKKASLKTERKLKRLLKEAGFRGENSSGPQCRLC